MKQERKCRCGVQMRHTLVLVTLVAVVLPGAGFVVGAEADQSSVVQAVKPEQAASECDVPSLIPPDSVRRAYSLGSYLGVNLLEQARNVVSRRRSGDFLVEQVQTRVSELSADSLSQREQKGNALEGNCFLRVNQLVVDSADPEYHRLVRQALAELAGNGAPRIKVSATFVCFARSAYESWGISTKPVQSFSSQQSLAEQVDVFCQLETFEPERVHSGTLYHEIYHREDSPFTRHDFREAARQNKFGGSSRGSVLLANGQTIRMIRKLNLKHSSIDEHIAQERGLYDSGQVLELKVNDAPTAAAGDLIRLNFNFSSSYIEGKQTQAIRDPETQEEKQVAVPLMRRFHFEDTVSLRPGQSLLVGGLPVSTKREDPLLTGLILRVERVQIPEGWLTQR
ncbi:hypothetical protein Pan153_58240 [Gimesia panareensis]|uniref:Uncharacterized protein n=2 Tax=Gimesia panareensis TaxID=2527978 RepID=A0A518FXR6_9PLAN|nr:hypothetical protein Pan153_58240 [Gimesia panareensis]